MGYNSKAYLTTPNSRISVEPDQSIFVQRDYFDDYMPGCYPTECHSDGSLTLRMGKKKIICGKKE